MSVLAADRSESRYEAVIFSVELHKMLTEFMQRDFGVRSVENFVRVEFAHGKIPTEDFGKYRYLMHHARKRIDMDAALVTSRLRDAYSRYPTSMHEYYKRRDCQNEAIGFCEAILSELQRVVDIFNVDINLYGKYVQAIDREIGLIKRWRQRDNKIKTYLESKGDV